MNIIIKTKNLELTDYLEKFVNDKIGKLEKFTKTLSNDSFDMFVEIEKETKHHRKGDVFMAEATIHLLGKSLIAKSHGENLLKAIIEVKDEMEVEIKKHKLKLIKLPRRKAKKLGKEEIF